MDSLHNFAFREVVFKEGAKANKLFLVKSGEVLCLKASTDRLIPVFLAKAGDIIGESAMIENMEYTYSAITLSESQLVEVPAMSFKKVLDSAPDWLIELTTTMITRFQNTANLIAENRMIHSSIISEEMFTPSLELEFKKLLNQ